MRKFNLFKLAESAENALNVGETIGEHTGDEQLATDISKGRKAITIAKLAITHKWLQLVKMGFDALLKMAFKDPFSYDDYLTAISQYIDVKIQQFSQEESLRFVGGECILTVISEEDRIQVKAQMYFKNSANKWIVKEMNGNTAFDCFTDEALDGEIAAIAMEGQRKLPILPPQA